MQADREWIETLGELGRAIASITPWYLAPWQYAIAQNPVVAGASAAMAAFSYWRGKSLSTRIADRARAAWSIGHNPQQEALRPSVFDRLALTLLGSPGAKAAWVFTSGKLFPAFVMLLALLVPAMFVDRSLLWLKSSHGDICPSQTRYEDLSSVIGQWQEIEFRADDPCMATKFRVRQGRRYELRLTLPPKGEWKDAGNEADWTGLDFSKLGWGQALIMYVGTPMRRNVGEPWFVPIARVGAYGSEEYALKPADTIEGLKPRDTMTSVITPRKNGQLFLFVNDAHSGFLPLAWLESNARQKSGWSAPHLYGNNTGTATVWIRREDRQDD